MNREMQDCKHKNREWQQIGWGHILICLDCKKQLAQGGSK